MEQPTLSKARRGAYIGPIGRPMGYDGLPIVSSNTKLTKGKECESVDSTKYQGMIEAPKTSHLEAVKRIFQCIKSTTHLGLWYPKGIGIETVVYADSDHAGDYVDPKSTSGIYTFVGCCLTSWFSKKQTALAISTTEVEYVSTRKAYQQALWMKQALIDYDVRLDDVPIMYEYIKNHKKTIKNGQARTQERKSEQKPEAKARKSQIYSQL
ncbi:hypothetical protein Tco_1162897, partial [Tanacetum coccineum]